MSEEYSRLSLPYYQEFDASLAPLSLGISSSELHGIMCSYVCASRDNQGENYLRALASNKKDAMSRTAILALFEVFAISQQQIAQFDFEFQMLLPSDDAPLLDRARAFSEWCKGFTENLTLLGIERYLLEDEEIQEALHHLEEFAELDYNTLDISEEDEQALMEVSEYARMAVIKLHHDLLENQSKRGGSQTH